MKRKFKRGKMGFEEKFIDKQRNHMNDDAFDETRVDVHRTWFDENTVDYWRHDRMYSTISPLGKFFNKRRWVTIGDGRYGLDSYRLRKKFGISAFPTDISENMLKEGKSMAIIKEYGVENAEALSFDTESFDVIFCKEAFHHFPRPIVALYEMLRVASEVVILIEPYDEPFSEVIDKKKYIVSAFKMIVNKFTGKHTKPYIPVDRYYNIPGSYELAGNYVYGVSIRELNKIAHALNLGGVAYYPLNDLYVKGAEFEKAEPQNELFKSIQRSIHRADLSGRFNMCTTIIFKTKIDDQLKREMQSFGYIFPDKTDNPYVNDFY